MATTYVGKDGKTHSIFVTKTSLGKKLEKFYTDKKVSFFSLLADLKAWLPCEGGRISFNTDGSMSLAYGKEETPQTSGIVDAITHIFWSLITISGIIGILATLHQKEIINIYDYIAKVFPIK